MNNNMKIILLVFMSSIVVDVVIRSFSESKGSGTEINRTEPSLSERVQNEYSIDESSAHSTQEEDYSTGGEIIREPSFVT
jgi:hypothetical protein